MSVCAYMRHVGFYRLWAVLLLTLLHLQPAFAAVPRADADAPSTLAVGQQQALFAFGTLIYAASSVASPAERRLLQPFLLTYRPDLRLEGRYPLRRAVAEATGRWPLDLRQDALSYLLGHRAAITNFNAMVLQTVGGAPAFDVLSRGAPAGAPEQKIYADRQMLADLLRRTWTQGQGAHLWQAQRQAWTAAQPQPHHLAQLAAAIARYSRSGQTLSTAGSQVVADPLMPPGSGVTSLFADGHFLMVIGPSDSIPEQDMLISHELLHPIVHALIHTDSALWARLQADSCSFDAIASGDPQNVLTHFVYTSWESYLSEVLVRSISHRLAGVANPAVDPFVIAPLVQQELQVFEHGQLPLTQAIGQLSRQLAQRYCRSLAA